MPLPKISTPTYELELPSTGKTIKFRPFLVKEEKLLVLALESNDTKEITNAIKAVLKDCIQTRGIKVESLPTFDIEYLFLNIRGKSVGEEIEVSILCPDDGETQVKTTVNLDQITVQRNDDHDKEIDLGSGLVMKMKYPSLEQFVETNFDVSGGNDENFKKSMGLIASCIDSVYNADEAWDASDCTKKELTDFIEQLNTKQFKKVEKFFETIPKLSYTTKVKNPKTEVESEVVIEGLASFFA